MSKILVNYHYNKAKDKYSILDNEYVFANLPVAVMDSDVVFNEPLVVTLDNLQTVVEKKEFLSKNRLFKLALDENGNLIEADNGVEMYLPIETDLSKLAYVNGRIVPKEEADPVKEPEAEEDVVKESGADSNEE